MARVDHPPSLRVPRPRRAPYKDAATAAAIERFGISDDEREWLVVRPAHWS
jgi:hypothetical protein